MQDPSSSLLPLNNTHGWLVLHSLVESLDLAASHVDLEEESRFDGSCLLT